MTPTRQECLGALWRKPRGYGIVCLVASALIGCHAARAPSDESSGPEPAPPIEFVRVAVDRPIQGWTLDDGRLVAVSNLGQVSFSDTAAERWSDTPVVCPSDFIPPGYTKPIVRPEPILDDTPGVAVTDRGALLLAGGMEDSPDSSILRSSNGGRTWTRPAVLQTGLLTDLAWRESSGIAVGFGGALVSVDDDGRSWTQIDSPTNLDLFAVASEPSFSIAVGDQGVVLRSTDPSAHEWSGATFGSVPLHDVDTLASGDVWVVGERGTILKSTDAGVSFVDVGPAQRDALTRKPTIASVLAVDRPDRRLVIAGTENGVVLVGDGDGAWTRVSIAGEQGAITSLIQIDHFVLAASTTGSIYRAEIPA